MWAKIALRVALGVAALAAAYFGKKQYDKTHPKKPPTPEAPPPAS
jgi:hypothetical protein